MFYFSEEVITYIIETYTFESGVRGLKRKIEKIMNKINLEKLYQNGIFENKIDTTCRLIISKEMIDKYLEKPNIIPKDKWVVNGDKYRITHVYYHPNQAIPL